MFKKFGLAAVLALVAGLVQPPASPRKSFPQASRPSGPCEARLEQQKSKWAPNGMKVLIIHGKRCWVQKREDVPILKGDV